MVGTKLTQNIIAESGDIQIETLNAQSDVLTFLRKWKTVDNKTQLDNQNELLPQGIENNGYKFSNNVSVKKDTTYIMRSIAYFDKYRTFWNTDQIVVFRIVGLEPDGSLIILWKNLKKSNAPMLSL